MVSEGCGVVAWTSKIFCNCILIMLTLLPCAAQQTFLTTIAIHNHGGYSLLASLGANRGDHMQIDVWCDHTIEGDCFLTAPYLSDFTPFVLKHSSVGHQTYTLDAPTTGDQIIHADYWWIGAQVHYSIYISSEEPL
jgi:hypothetical protein